MEEGAAVREALLDLLQAVLNRFVGLALLVVVAGRISLVVEEGPRKEGLEMSEKEVVRESLVGS